MVGLKVRLLRMVPQSSVPALTALRHQPYAVVAGGDVGRAAEVDIIVRRVTAAWYGNWPANIREVGGVAPPGATGCRLHGVGGPTSGCPGDHHVVALPHETENAEHRSRIGSIKPLQK